MRKIWVTSDQHFGHKNILKFTGHTDELIRPGFKDVDHMNQVMVDRWNEKVSDDDLVYHLGDIGFNRATLENVLPQLNGTKRLILGNHDKFEMSFYSKYFQKIMVVRQFGRVILSHYPIHLDPNDPYSYELNIHGHIHQNDSPTPNHVNVSVEKTDYYPIELDELVKDCKKFRK